MTERLEFLDFTLETPVTVNGETHEVLHLKRQRGKDLVVMDKFQGQLQRSYAMYASMADVTLPVIEAMDGDDIERLTEEAVPLLGKSMRRLHERLIKASRAGMAALGE